MVIFPKLAGRLRAEEALVDRRMFRLDEAKWQTFQDEGWHWGQFRQLQQVM